MNILLHIHLWFLDVSCHHIHSLSPRASTILFGTKFSAKFSRRVSLQLNLPALARKMAIWHGHPKFHRLVRICREVWKNITLSIHKEGPSKICFPVDFGSGLDCAVCHCHFQQRIGLSVPARSTGLRAEQCFVGAVSVSLCKYSFGHCTDAQCIDYCFCELLVVFVHVFVLPNDDSEFANSLVCTQPPKRTTEINKYYHKMTDDKSTRRIIMKIHRYPQYH